MIPSQQRSHFAVRALHLPCVCMCVCVCFHLSCLSSSCTRVVQHILPPFVSVGFGRKNVSVSLSASRQRLIAFPLVGTALYFIYLFFFLSFFLSFFPSFLLSFFPSFLLSFFLSFSFDSVLLFDFFFLCLCVSVSLSVSLSFWERKMITLDEHVHHSKGPLSLYFISPLLCLLRTVAGTRQQLWKQGCWLFTTPRSPADVVWGFPRNLESRNVPTTGGDGMITPLITSLSEWDRLSFPWRRPRFHPFHPWTLEPTDEPPICNN